MVVQAPPNYNASQPTRTSPVSSIKQISSLKRYSDREHALDILHQMVKAVAPLIHEYNFRVGLLCEMYPKNPSLLGLNVNKGQKILIRLRLPYNDRLFYPMSELLGTFLHELTHNVHGPHDGKFYRLLDELKAKFETGGFQAGNYVCEENTLGSSYSPFGKSKSVRDKRLEALSKGKFKAEARRLGGSATRQMSIREAALMAAERRLQDSKWCPLANLDPLDLEEVLGPEQTNKSQKMKEYKHIIDLTKEGNDQDEEEIEIIEVDACDSLLLVHKVDPSQLWANALKPALDDEASGFFAGSTEPSSYPDVQVQYRVSNSPGKTFIGDEHVYPRRKLVADLDFDQIIEKGRLIQIVPATQSHADAQVSDLVGPATVEKRTKQLPHPEEGLDVKRKSKDVKRRDKQDGNNVSCAGLGEGKRAVKDKETTKHNMLPQEQSNTESKTGPKSRRPSRAKDKSTERKESRKEVRNISFAELLR